MDQNIILMQKMLWIFNLIFELILLWHLMNALLEIQLKSMQEQQWRERIDGQKDV
jgi:hypothetical protein